MVSKVELDLLEETDTPIAGGPSDENEPAEKGKFQNFFARMTRRKIVGGCILVAFSCIVVVSLLVFSGSEQSRVSLDTPRADVTLLRPIENLDSFIIDLSDEHGHYKVLVCDIAIEVEPGKRMGENKAEVRKKIYNALKDKSMYILKTAGYHTIKREMRDELNRIMGGGIQEVYFTKFVIL
jgi:flagellar basal body-associated protein FliL